MAYDAGEDAFWDAYVAEDDPEEKERMLFGYCDGKTSQLEKMTKDRDAWKERCVAVRIELTRVKGCFWKKEEGRKKWQSKWRNTMDDYHYESFDRRWVTRYLYLSMKLLGEKHGGGRNGMRAAVKEVHALGSKDSWENGHTHPEVAKALRPVLERWGWTIPALDTEIAALPPVV